VGDDTWLERLSIAFKRVNIDAGQVLFS